MPKTNFRYCCLYPLIYASRGLERRRDQVKIGVRIVVGFCLFLAIVLFISTYTITTNLSGLRQIILNTSEIEFQCPYPTIAFCPSSSSSSSLSSIQCSIVRSQMLLNPQTIDNCLVFNSDGNDVKYQDGLVRCTLTATSMGTESHARLLLAPPGRFVTATDAPCSLCMRGNNELILPNKYSAITRIEASIYDLLEIGTYDLLELSYAFASTGGGVFPSSSPNSSSVELNFPNHLLYVYSSPFGINLWLLLACIGGLVFGAKLLADCIVVSVYLVWLGEQAFDDDVGDGLERRPVLQNTTQNDNSSL